MEFPRKPTSSSTTSLDQPPSCLAFCPTAPEHLVIGTYLLSEVSVESPAASQQTRTGSLQLFKFDPVSFDLTQVQRLPLEHAVFDLHFSPREPSLFAVALSTAAVSLFRVIGSAHSSAPAIEFVNTFTVHEDPSLLTLYLAWIPPFQSGQDNGDADRATDGFAVSLSNGQVSVFHTTTNSPSRELTRDSTSEIRFPGFPPIEVWYLAFSSRRAPGSQIPTLLSGDDFAQVREFCFPSNPQIEREDGQDTVLDPYQKFNDRGKLHGAGVTAILPLSCDETAAVLLTGSYDGCIRIYRLGARGSVLAEKDLGGGVWRLKLIPLTVAHDMPADTDQGGRRYLVLASCMHAGARVVEVSFNSQRNCNDDDDGLWSFRVLAEFTGHTSMNYASDFWMSRNEESGDSELFCVSSSFYDKRVCVWRPFTAQK